MSRLLFAAGAAFAISLANGQDVTEEASRTPEELDKLVAPIALYPDALVALILPASTVPTDVTLAARFLAAGNGDTAIEDQPWDDSVKALVHYPEVVKWMDENLVWTRELGLAFADQSADVMSAVQRQRVRARTAGTLQDTPQQEVIVRDQIIYIEPAMPDVIYVPRYDYEVVYGPLPFGYAGPFLTFGLGYSIGTWLAFDLDWHSRVLWRGVDWRRRDYRVRHYGPPVIAGHPYRPPQRWHPPVNRVRPRPGFHRDDRIVGPRALPTGPMERDGRTARPKANFANTRSTPTTTQPLAGGAPSVRRWSQGEQSRPRVNPGPGPQISSAPTVTRPPMGNNPTRPVRSDVSPRPDNERANVRFNTSRPMVTPSGPIATVRAPSAPVSTPQSRPAPMPQTRPAPMPQARPVPMAPPVRSAPMAPPPAMRPVTAPAPRSAPAERTDTPDQRRDNRGDKER